MRRRTPLGLVIAPTRELAIQVQRELDWLYAAAGIRTATCVGGMDMRSERRTLERGPIWSSERRGGCATTSRGAGST